MAFGFLTFRGARARPSSALKGTTAVEFAITAPLFFLLMSGILEFSLMSLAQHLLENATFNASRTSKTGYVATGKTQQQTITAVLNNELKSFGNMIDVAKITMTSTSYGQLSQIGQANQGTPGLGNAQDVVVFTVSYPWKLFTPGVSSIIGTNGIVTLTSRIVVRNEPY